MTPWINFFLLTGEAAATLVGLMFIAVTFGQKIMTKETAGIARDILSPTFFHFAHAFILASVAMIPSESVMPVTAASLVLATMRLIHVPKTIRQLKNAGQTGHIESSDWAFDVVVPAIIYGAFIVCGIATLIGAAWGMYGTTICILSMLILGILAAWDMLLWMATRIE